MNKTNTRQLVLCAIFTALTIVLQLLGAFIRFGMFSISLVLVPIVLGAALCGTKAGAWLGAVFGAVVLLSGDAAPFLTVSVPGTVITVMLKGILAGLCAGLVYRLVARKNRDLAVVCAAVVCPVVNTGVFLLGCMTFFMDTISGWAAAVGLGGDVAHYMIVVMVGVNFLVELGVNIVLSPIIVRLLNIKRASA